MRMRRTIGLSLALLVVSAAMVAKQAHSAQPQPHPGAKAKPAKTETAGGRKASKRPQTDGKTTAHHSVRHEPTPRQSAERPAPPDQYVGPLQVVGAQETGSAAWYGPRHIGHRTASGDRLDAIHPTAAHRSLPLNSLARVTNLKNGRSVIVKVTDRGPWSPGLLIDVSPKAADELDMKRAGIVRVKIEQVVRASPKPHLASGTTSGAD
jgi:rare lipoprotein A